jgi:hypothetical protein
VSVDSNCMAEVAPVLINQESCLTDWSGTNRGTPPIYLKFKHSSKTSQAISVVSKSPNHSRTQSLSICHSRAVALRYVREGETKSWGDDIRQTGGGRNFSVLIVHEAISMHPLRLASRGGRFVQKKLSVPSRFIFNSNHPQNNNSIVQMQI